LKALDKAKVEVAVLLVERWILARLRNHRFYSLGELNLEIRKLLTAVNQKPFKKMPGSRQSVFDEVEKPVLRPLPARPYEFATFLRSRKVHIDYHVEVDFHYYSVPYQLLRSSRKPAKKIARKPAEEIVRIPHL